MESDFKVSTKRARASLVMAFTFVLGAIPVFLTMYGMIFAGSNPPREFAKSRFSCFEKSLSTRLSSVWRSSAGLKSISAVYFAREIFFIWQDAERTRGPLRPKWVKSISPISSKTILPFSLFRIFKVTFLSERPIISDTSSTVSTGTSDGTSGTISCPSAFAKRYPSPSEPVPV